MTQVSSPVQIGVKTNANAIGKIVTTSSGTTAILDGLGRVYTLGSGGSGTLGDGTTVAKSTPTLVSLGSFGRTATKLQAGYTNLAAVANNTLYTWGDNSVYQLGDGTTIGKSSPVAISITKTIEYPWKSITQGVSHTTAIRITDGALFSWGNNIAGQLGDGTTVAKSAPIQIGNKSWSIISSGLSYTAAIDSTGALYTWGVNSSYQLGDGTSVSKSSPIQIGTSSWTSVSAGDSHVTAIDINGNLYAWGNNNNGRVGYISNTPSYSTPQKIPSAVTTYSWKQLSVNKNGTFTAGITTSGSLYTWGLGTSGQLGDGTVGSKSSPVLIGNSSWNAVSAGNLHVIAIDVNGRLFAWGLGTSGQLGDNTSVSKSSPVLIGTSSWTSVSAGDLHSTAIDINGNLYTWGSNSTGQIGYGVIAASYSTPQKIATAIGNVFWKQLVTNTDGTWTAGITTTGALYTWGNNANGQLGDGTIIGKSSPVKIGSNSWSVVSAGYSHMAAIDSTGALYAWGLNSSSQLGDGTTINKSSPVKIGTSSWSAVSAGAQNMSAIDSTGALYAWGLNGNGQLGDGTTVNKSVPIKIGTNSWSIVSSTGQYYTTAIDSTGALYAWGLNATYQIGDGTTINKSSPVKIGSFSWTKVSAGASHIAAVTTNGSLFTWGVNINGQLGDGTIISKSTPVQTIVTAPNIFNKIGVGGTHVVSIDTVGALWVWGDNQFGQLGDGTTINKSSPVKIGTSSWSIANAGSYSTAAIDINGRLYTWGYNATGGQLGSGTTINRSAPLQIGTSSWTAINVGYFNMIGITLGGALYTWGRGSGGELGDGTTIDKSAPVKIGSSSWSYVSSGGPNIGQAAIDANGSLYTWGTGSNGVLGDGTTVSKSSPVKIGSNSWTIITSCNNSHRAGIINDGSLYTWGGNSSGQIGDGTTINKSSPVKIGLNSWSFVSTGYFDTLAIDSTGALYVWGDSGSGVLGDNTIISKSSPVKLGTSSWISVGINNGVTVAGITFGGSLYAWGGGYSGSIGNMSTLASSSPVFVWAPNPVAPVVSWTSVSAGGTHTTAIDTTGTMYAWGLNSSGQLGDGLTVSKSTAIKLGSYNYPPTASWLSVSAGGLHTAAITTANTAYIWGFNNAGQLGDNTTSSKSSPVLVSAFEDSFNTYSSWTAVNAGIGYTAAITTAGALYAWGVNNIGQLGDGTTISKSSPVQIGTSSWTKISAGGSHTTAIDATGKLYAWGLGTGGQLGDNTAISKSTPVQTVAIVPLLLNTQWKQVTSGTSNSMAISTTGALWGWGYNLYSQLGNGTNSAQSSGVQIGTSSWTIISQGPQHTLGITSTGALFAWGLGTSGQLGDSTLSSKSSPVQIGSSSWTSVSAGSTHTAAIDTTGALYIWGNNTNGILGDGTTINKSSPVKIGTSSWSKVSAGAQHMAAIDATGALFTWGYNGYANLGDGTTVSKSSPVKIGTSSWSLVSAGQYTTVGITTTGNLYTWGLNNGGFLGDGTTVSKSSPVKIGTNSWSFLGTTLYSSSFFAIDSTGALYAWGDNTNGVLGDGTTINRSLPLQIGTSSWTLISSSDSSHGIDINGNLWAWGLNSTTQLSDGTTVNKSTPVLSARVPSTTAIVSWNAVSAGLSHSVGIDTTGNLYTWGLGTTGQLGDNTAITKSSAVKFGLIFGTNLSWTSVSAGGLVTTGITSANTLYTWGNNTNGQLGDYTSVTKSSPVLINIYNEALNIYNYSWTSVSAGSSHTAAIQTTGALWTWGSNVNGQLGDGTTIDKSSPVKIGTSSWSIVSAAASHTAGVTTTANTLYTWGGNLFGQLGDGSTTDKSTPTQISSSWTYVTAGFWSTAGIKNGFGYAWGYGIFGLLANISVGSRSTPAFLPNNKPFTSWKSISAGGQHSSGINAADNSLWIWGLNNNGQLGDGTTIYKPDIDTFLSEKSWTSVDAGGTHTVAIDITGALYTWGQNTVGQLGDGTTIDKSSPVQIGTSSWTKISAGDSHTMAIDSTGALYTWGYNSSSYGTLGDGTTINKSSPVKIGSSSWSAVSAGIVHSLAIDITGALYAWGYNNTGNLGDSTATNRSSPVKIGSSSWTMISANGNGNSAAIDINGRLFTWGAGFYGQLGQSNYTDRVYSPVQVGTSSWAMITVGGVHMAAIDAVGRLFAWGDRSSAQVGDNFSQSTNVGSGASSPVLIGGTSSWSIVSAGYVYTIAQDIYGNTYGWGQDTSGQLGTGFPTLYRAVPIITNNLNNIKNPKAPGWKSFSFNASNTAYGITSTDSLYAWGANTSNKFGFNDTPGSRKSPDIFTVAGSNLNIIDVAMGNNTTIAITSDNETNSYLYAWGNNAVGQYGDGTNVSRSSPVLVTQLATGYTANLFSGGAGSNFRR
jgi:alpha-tubulin suppressor-like RCC1 family protein